MSIKPEIDLKNRKGWGYIIVISMVYACVTSSNRNIKKLQHFQPHLKKLLLKIMLLKKIACRLSIYFITSIYFIHSSPCSNILTKNILKNLGCSLRIFTVQ